MDLTARLAPGESRTLNVRAKARWNSSGVAVRQGESYRLSAEGTWSDCRIGCGPEGYPTEAAPLVSRWLLRRFESKRRVPREPWFRLMGAVGRDESGAFAIGSEIAEWRPGAAGELQCFANDVKVAYWNNSGAVRLTVRRIG